MARLRRATVIETGLFEIQAQHLRDCRERCRPLPDSCDVIQAMLQQGASNYAVDRLIRYEATVGARSPAHFTLLKYSGSS